MSFKIIMKTSVTRPSFATQHQTCKTKTKSKTGFFWSETGLVLRPTVSDHITADSGSLVDENFRTWTVADPVSFLGEYFLTSAKASDRH